MREFSPRFRLIMLYAFVAGLRRCCIAAFLLLATIQAGEPPHPLMGLSRDQILNRLGEPRSQMTAGGREVMFYPRERLVLTNGVVVEVERLVADPPRKAPIVEPSPRAPAPTSGGAAKADEGTEPASKTVNAPTRAPEPAETAEPKLEIRLVRPSAGGAPANTIEPAPAVQTVPPAASGESVAATAPVGKSSGDTPAPPVPAPTPATPPSAAASQTPTSTASTPTSASPSPKAAVPVAASTPSASPSPAAAVRNQTPNTPVEPESGLGMGGAIGLVGGVLLLGIVGFFVWRARQRKLELEATAVEATPVGAAAMSRAAEAGFSAALLASLDAAQLEELVAAYYVKTGVVATRVSGDPASPFQIRISWKGEARAFALVQCLAQPEGTIDTKPLVRLHAILDKEKVRRGYVVTPGKFSTAARDLAEQKGLTLLPGDVFLEKLLALPDSARAELMRAIPPKA